MPFVNGTLRVHRIPPHVRDDRETPLIGGGTAWDMQVIWAAVEAVYFSGEDWTGQISLKRFRKFGCARRCRGPPGSLQEPTDRAKARITGFQTCWIDQTITCTVTVIA